MKDLVESVSPAEQPSGEDENINDYRGSESHKISKAGCFPPASIPHATRRIAVTETSLAAVSGLLLVLQK